MTTQERMKNFLGETKKVFSIQNLTLSLLSVLLVIGIGYLSNFVSEIIQSKLYSAPMMSLAYSLSVTVAYLLAILGPAILYAVKTKKWESIVYIVLLEIVWFAIFIAVLYFTTPEKSYNYNDLLTM